MAVKTVRVLAALTATLHDGKNMIVLTEGKYARVAETSLSFLREKEAIDEDGPLDHDGDGGQGGSKPADPPGLTGKNKDQLLAIAEEESVAIEDGATKADIVAAIELAREAKSEGDKAP